MGDINLDKEQQLAATLNEDFTRLDARVVRNRRVEAFLKSNDIIPSVLLFAKDIWRHANTYEREIREMFGIDFPGLVANKEFILEDWQDMPPMRRDFKTKEYVDDHYFERPGREDAQDVRETIADRSGEVIPEFAKKFSRK